MLRVLSLFATVALLPAAAEAQESWARKYRKDEVERTIKRVESRSDSFQKAVDKRLDRSALDGSGKEQRINREVSDLEAALDRLRRRFDRSDAWWETRVDVEAVMQEGRDVNAIMAKSSLFGSDIRNRWYDLKRDLNGLAKVYDLPPLY